MKILVTGGQGYIGRAAVSALLAAGHEVASYDLAPQNHHPAAVKALTSSDILWPAHVRMALRLFKPAVVLHLAGRSLVGQSIARPGDYWQANVEGTRVLLEAMLAERVERLVLASSCAVYRALPYPMRLSEDFTCLPPTPYGASKYAAEMLADCYAGRGIKTTVLRFFNVAGAADSVLDTVNTQRLIPQALMASDSRPLKVRGSLKIARDYVHVLDAAHACRVAVESTQFATFNIGRGIPYTIGDVLAEVERQTGRAVAYTLDTGLPGEPASLVANPQRACQGLGWRPSRHLGDMVADAARLMAGESQRR